jgi:hypothetical protein
VSFNPSEPRVPAGVAAGGQWGTPTKAKKKTTTARGSSKAAAKPGPARNAAAAKVQQNPQAQKLYDQLLQAPPGQRAAYVKGLSTDDLKLLTQIVYSSRTSDPNVVNARIAVANEMTRRGVDIKQYGALGGGLPAARVAVLRKVAAARVTTRAVPRPAAAAPSTPSSSPLPRLGRATPI